MLLVISRGATTYPDVGMSDVVSGGGGGASVYDHKIRL
jgi:hypothetical protein